MRTKLIIIFNLGKEISEPNTPEICTSITPPSLKPISEVKTGCNEQICMTPLETTTL